MPLHLVEVTAYNLPINVVVAMIQSGKMPTGIRKDLVFRLLKASAFVLRLAGWVGYGVSPWEDPDETECRVYGYDGEHSEDANVVDDYGNA